MKSILLFSFSLIYSYCQTGDRCNQILNGDSVFTITPLSSSIDYSYEFTQNGKPYILIYNFCTKIKSKCGENYPYAALFEKEGEKKCVSLTSDSILFDYRFDLIDTENPNSGIVYTQNGGDKFSENRNYSFSVTIRCKNAPLPFAFNFGYLVNEVFFIQINSKYGCPIIALSEIWEFFSYHWFLVSLGLIAIGVVLAFYGYSMLKPVLYIIGYLTGFLGLSFIWAEFLLSPNTHYGVIALLLLLSAFVGVAVGYAFINLPRIGITVACVWTGILLSFLIHTLFFSGFKTTPDNLILWILWAILGISFGVIGYFFWKDIIIIVTSANGSYCIAKGLGLIFGGFPNELTVSKSLKYKEIEDIPVSYYIYTILIVVLTICGIFYQMKRKIDDDTIDVISPEDLMAHSSVHTPKNKKENEDNYIALNELN